MGYGTEGSVALLLLEFDAVLIGDFEVFLTALLSHLWRNRDIIL